MKACWSLLFSLGWCRQLGQRHAMLIAKIPDKDAKGLIGKEPRCWNRRASERGCSVVQKPRANTLALIGETVRWKAKCETQEVECNKVKKKRDRWARV
jgi:hypothetical protein